MSDLVAFLTARFDEDEVAAKTAEIRRPGPWAAMDATGLGSLHFATEIRDSQGKPVAVVSGGYITAHIARHDPARVLREVEAKRKILADYERLLAERKSHPHDLAQAGALLALLGVVRALAAVYSDHQ